jgi:thioredoxin 1
MIRPPKEEKKGRRNEGRGFEASHPGGTMRTVHREKRVVWVAALAGVLILLLLCPLAWPDAPASKDKAAKSALPRMVDLGRSRCTPCKMMAPVLEELKREYAGVIDIEFIDIAKNPDAMDKLGVEVRGIPFQAFYDASGRIVKHHYGYMPKEEIVRAFRELGFDPKKPQPAKR